MEGESIGEFWIKQTECQSHHQVPESWHKNKCSLFVLVLCANNNSRTLFVFYCSQIVCLDSGRPSLVPGGPNLVGLAHPAKEESRIQNFLSFLCLSKVSFLAPNIFFPHTKLIS